MERKITVITSRQNDRVKAYASLDSATERRNQSIYWCEGTRCVDAALTAHADKTSVCNVKELIVSTHAGNGVQEQINRADTLKIPVTCFAPHCYDKMSQVKNSEGISAIISLPATTSLPEKSVNSLLLWHVQDPGNMGGIIRSAAAFGWTTCVAVQPHVDPYHPRAVRASAGVICSAKIHSCSENTAREWLAERKESACVFGVQGGQNPDVCRQEFHTCIIGSEAHGVPKDIEETGTLLTIPLSDNVESLNVNAAAAVGLYALQKRTITIEKSAAA